MFLGYLCRGWMRRTWRGHCDFINGLYVSLLSSHSYMCLTYFLQFCVYFHGIVSFDESSFKLILVE
jgi:hypothetical protein